MPFPKPRLNKTRWKNKIVPSFMRNSIDISDCYGRYQMEIRERCYYCEEKLTHTDNNKGAHESCIVDCLMCNERLTKEEAETNKHYCHHCANNIED